MIDIMELKVGDKVRYQPEYYSKDKWENGMIKEIPDFKQIPDFENVKVRVVYHCAGNWGCFDSYTGALTNVEDLNIGWK